MYEFIETKKWQYRATKQPSNKPHPIRYKTTLAEIGEGKLYQLFHGNSKVHVGFENRSVRYFSTSKPNMLGFPSRIALSCSIFKPSRSRRVCCGIGSFFILLYHIFIPLPSFCSQSIYSLKYRGYDGEYA